MPVNAKIAQFQTVIKNSFSLHIDFSGMNGSSISKRLQSIFINIYDYDAREKTLFRLNGDTHVT